MKNSKKKVSTDPKKQSNIISDQFKQNEVQENRQDRKKYESLEFGKDFKDKDYEGSNYEQEDDYNSNKLGNGSDAVNENLGKKIKRKVKE